MEATVDPERRVAPPLPHSWSGTSTFARRATSIFVVFVEENGSPKKNNERLLLAVFWLERVVQVEGVTADHVYTCFKEAKWKVPANLRNALQVVATRKGWITTTNMDDIKVEIAGENFVEHDLAARAAG